MDRASKRSLARMHEWSASMWGSATLSESMYGRVHVVHSERAVRRSGQRLPVQVDAQVLVRQTRQVCAEPVESALWINTTADTRTDTMKKVTKMKEKLQLQRELLVERGSYICKKAHFDLSLICVMNSDGGAQAGHD